MLDASHNHIADISKLASCASMKVLNLQDNQISSLSALGNGFVDLEALNVAKNSLVSLKDLSGCANLKAVVAYNNQLTSLDGLENKPQLMAVLADENHIESISALSTSTKVLLNLDLGHNQISDVSALSGLASGASSPMVRVLLDHNRIDDVSELPHVAYNVLALHGNPLSDFSEFAECKWNALYLPYAQNADYGTLGQLGTLNSLRLVGVPYDRQVQVVRDMGASESGRKPVFLTEEEADAELQDVRSEIYRKIGDTANDDDSDESHDGEDTASESSSASGADETRSKGD